MKEKLINLGFNEWLQALDIAPYPVIFWDTPKFIQLSYIQRYLREAHLIHIEVYVGIDSKWYFTGYNLADKRSAEIVELCEKGMSVGYEFYEEALEVVLLEGLNLNYELYTGLRS